MGYTFGHVDISCPEDIRRLEVPSDGGVILERSLQDNVSDSVGSIIRAAQENVEVQDLVNLGVHGVKKCAIL